MTCLVVRVTELVRLEMLMPLENWQSLLFSARKALFLALALHQVLDLLLIEIMGIKIMLELRG